MRFYNYQRQITNWDTATEYVTKDGSETKRKNDRDGIGGRVIALIRSVRLDANVDGRDTAR